MTRSKKIAYTATASAIGIVAITAAMLMPSSIPYIVAGLALYIVLFKCGYAFGALSYASVSAVALLINPIGALPFVLLFGLHPFVSFSLAKLEPRIKDKNFYWCVRSLALIAFFVPVFYAVYYLAANAMFDTNTLTALIGGVHALVALGAVAFLLYDLASTIITGYVIKQI